MTGFGAPPRTVRRIDNTWIPLHDGTRLAARVWLPEDADSEPVPAVLEYVPYRKNDWFAARDAARQPDLARHGYAAVRVDVRGSGDSDGILLDEYLAQEQDDAVEVIAWLAAQPWCTGAVGMIGLSWGGFAALQVAARRPPALRAIITVCSTDDRYADDCHYMGGCVLGLEMLWWASTMFAYNARPPDPLVVGERWERMWHERLEQTPPFVEAWLSHQRRDQYWRHGSVCEDYGAIECPVYTVGGWGDAYTNAVLRLMQHLRCPAKGLIGPWTHAYPDVGTPGPQIDFVRESVRWWDHWLKGADTGIMDEPRLRAWMPEAARADPGLKVSHGRWVAEVSWPPSDQPASRWYLGDGTLERTPGGSGVHRIVGAQATGAAAGVWCPYGREFDLPGDQRAEDGLSLSFTSPPLAERLELLGVAQVRLAVSADQPCALVAVRLCDVGPEGSSTLITRGLLNLTRPDSRAEPRPLEPGRECEVSVPLKAVAYALPVGHRLRVSVSPTYWPWAWPSPVPVRLSLRAGDASWIDLPSRRPRPEDDALRLLAPPEPAAHSDPLAVEVISTSPQAWELTTDIASGRHEMLLRQGSVVDDRGGRRRLLDTGLEIEEANINRVTIVESDPLSARVQCDWTVSLARGDWQIDVCTSSVMTCDAGTFLVTNTLEAYRGERRVLSRTWTKSIPRDLV